MLRWQYFNCYELVNSKWSSYLPASRFHTIRGFGDPLAKHGISKEFPEITSISFGGFSIQAGGTKRDCKLNLTSIQWTLNYHINFTRKITGAK